MSDEDSTIAKRSMDFQVKARDIPLPQIEAYRSWSKRKLDEGVNAALIAHLDATAMWLLPQEITTVGDNEFDELLEELQQSVDPQ